MAPSISRWSNMEDLTLSQTEVPVLVQGLFPGKEYRRFGFYECLKCAREWASAQTRCFYIEFREFAYDDTGDVNQSHTDRTGHVFEPVKNARQACFKCGEYKLPYDSQPLRCRVTGEFECDNDKCRRTWISKNTMLYQQYGDEDDKDSSWDNEQLSYKITEESGQECRDCHKLVLPVVVSLGGQSRSQKGHMPEHCERCLSGRHCARDAIQHPVVATYSRKKLNAKLYYD